MFNNYFDLSFNTGIADLYFRLRINILSTLIFTLNSHYNLMC